MPKHIEDIIMPERKRTIRNIPIPEGRRGGNGPAARSAPREQDSVVSLEDNANLFQTGPKFSTPWRGRRSMWAAAGVLILALAFAILSLFDGATLAYIPKSEAVTFNNDVYAAHKSGENRLLYSVVKLSGDKGLEVSASGEEKVERKASGIIIIYNTGTAQQRFRATTRFETPDGKIYQVKDAIVVPGKKVVGGVEEFGTLEVRVYAEKPGKEFNIGLSDFTLPGLKGTSSFSSVYARSKTEITGGFVGVEKVVSSQDKAQAKTQLEATLKSELALKAGAQVPDDFILLPSLSLITFEELPQTSSSNKDMVTVNVRANLLGVMFKKNDLFSHLALDKVTLTSGQSVNILGLNSLSFSFAGSVPPEILSANEVRFSVSGTATVEWNTDEVALKTDLAGRQKKDISSILNNYPTIASATATIRPFWKRSFPVDGANVSVKKLSVE